MSSARSANTSPETAVRITRFPSLTEEQFSGCTAAFVDSLSGELNAAASALRRLEGMGKGSAFAYEMTLDRHRYGALIVIDRWSTLAGAFGPHLKLSRHASIVTEAPARSRAAEALLNHANQLLDASERYSAEAVAACTLAYRSVETNFAEERDAAGQYSQLPDYQECRRIFLQDLAAR